MLQDILQDIIKEFDHVYIVIDALDECADRERLLKWLKNMPHWERGKLHALFSSRREPDIEDSLDDITGLRRLTFAGGSANPDIVKYVTKKLTEVKRWDSRTRVLVRDALLEGADGSFRWVALQLKELSRCSNLKSLKKQLENLPEDLEQTYQQLLSNTSQLQDLLTILQWVLFSDRPLGLEELAEVVTIDFGSGNLPSYDLELRYMDPREVLTVCSGFLMEFQGIVKLAHMSVKDYLLSDKILAGPASRFRMNEMQCHSLITQTSLAYLLQFGTLDSLGCMSVETYPLAPYAARHWASHWRGCADIPPSSPLDALITRFLLSAPKAYANWAWLVTVASEYSHCYEDLDWSREKINAHSSQLSTPLYLSALLGLFEPLKQLLAYDSSASMDIEWYWRALYLAACEGHHTIVELLINHTPTWDLNTMKYKNTPLIIAASQGRAGYVDLLDWLFPYDPMGERYIQTIMSSLLPLGIWGKIDVEIHEGTPGTINQGNSLEGIEATLRLLLRRGANVNAQDGDGRTALWYASHLGVESMVELLLEHGADANLRGEDGSALLQAVFNKHEAIARLLLQRGADANTYDGAGRTVLWYASNHGVESVVELLLENGADSNLRGEDGSALLQAVFKKHEAIARLLLQRGADANTYDGAGRTVLWHASMYGPESIVELLLEHGADVNCRGKSVGELLLAVDSNHAAIARLLLEHGANVDDQNDDERTALWYALMYGSESTVQSLLEHGADGNLRGESGGALRPAVGRSDAAIARLLLEYGADINAQDGGGRTAFFYASSYGSKATLELFLRRGVNVNAQDSEGKTALFYAANYNNEAALLLLLQRGANINARDGGGRTALSCTAECGNGDAVSLLLKHGADVNTLDDIGWNALQYALMAGNNATARLLLQCGADVNGQAPHGDTLLQVMSWEGQHDGVKLLLWFGADVNAQNGDCGTALCQASLRGHESIVRLLLQSGADVHINSGSLGSPLYAASFAYPRGDGRIEALLRSYGAESHAPMEPSARQFLSLVEQSQSADASYRTSYETSD
ncbi:hypothetical protein HWV62_9693 [Athelia sp. TMB]|nr:hypothetical protein HWV62_9693 [Athelia sp. TMB]